MAEVAKKICMVGPFSVGKTSLVRRYVESLFSDKYKTTIGVKISRKAVQHQGQSVQLLLWDIEGVDTFTSLRNSYLRGAAGIVLVLDGTRPDTLRQADELISQVKQQIEDAPIIVLLNKADLKDEWKLECAAIELLKARGLTLLETSAKTGENVNQAFTELLDQIMAKSLPEEA